jgi:lipoate-protein ligase A
LAQNVVEGLRIVEHLDLTLPSPAENLACDEALLDLCESGSLGEVLRFWESPAHFAVVGYGNHVDHEVDVLSCDQANIPILRRCSGGGTVLQGPGCLNYALILRSNSGSPVESISSTNCHIMSTHRDALRNLGLDIAIQGHTDLVLASNPPRKFSGNSQRRKRRTLLFHGTFLLDFDLGLIDKTLKFPSQQPAYRKSRSHTSFVINLPMAALQIKSCLKEAWSANIPFLRTEDLAASVAALAADKYSQTSWNRKT